MAVIGSIEYIAKINTSDYERGTQKIIDSNKKIEGSADKASKGIGLSMRDSDKAFGKLVKGGLKIATVGVATFAAAFTAGVLKPGIARALKIEDAQAKLRGLGHDTESVTTIMESALDSVKGTAYGLDQAATAAAGAVAAGVKPGQELTKYLSLAGDAATIAGVSFDEMGSIFGKVQSNQKAYTQELNQLADRGIPIYQWLQEELGVTAEELRKMVSQGEIDSDTYFKVIEKNIGGAALESGKTTRGALANMGAAFGRLGASLMEDALPAAKNFFGAVTKWVDENSPKIVEFVKSTVENIGNFINKLVELWPVIQQVGTVILIFLIPQLIRYIALQTVAGVQALIAGAKIAAGWLMALGPIGIIIAAVAAAAYLIIANWEHIKNFAIAVWEWIKGAWGAAAEWFGGIWEGIKNAFSAVGEWFKNIFQGAWDGIKKVFGAVGSFFRGIWDTIKSIFSTIGSAIGNAIGDAFKFVVNSIIGFAENTINGFIRAINGAIKLINKIPGVSIGLIGELKIPRLATGGITTGPTIAQIGEAGKEAVLPLENNTGWMDVLADKISGTGTNNQPVVVNLSHSRGVMRQAAMDTIDLVNEVYRSRGLPEIGVAA